MRRRCYDPNNDHYNSYGERGIIVCDAWQDFSVFKTWALTHGYQDGLTIERVDVNGNYEPGNCTWIPLDAQQRNTQRTHWVEAWGEKKSVIEWSEDPRCVVKYETLRKRIKYRGINPEIAVTTLQFKTGPIKKNNKCLK